MYKSPRNCILENLLKECYIRPHRRCSQHRNLHIEVSPSQRALKRDDVQNIAILGGGITGLAAADYLTFTQPNARITLYESGPRLGGWLRSTSVDVGTGKVIFEQGPRTLRPNFPAAWETLSMIMHFNLQDEVLMTAKESVAAKNRFIYYPDHLVRMPGPGINILENISTVLFEPAFKNILLSMVTEAFRSKFQPDVDVSVGKFLTNNRFAPEAVDNILSAVFHGVYAGDVYQLSARSIVPRFFEIAVREDESLLSGLYDEMTRDDKLQPAFDRNRTKQHLLHYLRQRGDDESIVKVVDQVAQSSVYTFKRGIGQLAESIELYLARMENVTIVKNAEVLGLKYRVDGSKGKILLERGQGKEPVAYSHVISTISSSKLNALVQPECDLSVLALTPAVTVMVVNLYYTNPNLLSVHGFGYLIPRSIPFDQNPERALGVVFDSDATIGQDAIPGTKLTVMLGGHWWDGWDSYPDEEEGAYMAKSILARHLGISEEPQAVRVSLQKDCIPQYTVGHAERMMRAHQQLLASFHGRLKVAGSYYTGVGLNDCVRAGYSVSHSFQQPYECTGLENLVPGLQKWERYAHDKFE